MSVEVKDTDEKVLENLTHNSNLKMIKLVVGEMSEFEVVVRTETLNRMIFELSKSLTSITIKGYHLDLHYYGDILEHVAKGVRENDTLRNLEIILKYTYDSRSQTLTGLVTLLNSLKSTPVQKLCFENVHFDGVCTEAFNQVLSTSKHLTHLAMKGKTYLTGSSSTLHTIKSLTEITFNGNKLGADGTVALLDFLRLNPQLAVLKASDCHLTDDLSLILIIGKPLP